MNYAEHEQYAKMLGPDREDVKRLLRTASRSEESARIARNIFRAKLRQAGIDPDNDEPFRQVLSQQALGGLGVGFGSPVGGDTEFVWRHDEIPYSLLAIGAPGFGKTSAIIHLLIQLAQYYPIIIPCLRGDYECLARVIPNSEFFIFGRFPINLLKGPLNVPPAVWNQRFSEIFIEQFDLFQSSRRYINLVLDSLDYKREQTLHQPCLFDLLDALEDKKEERGSDELRFRNRCMARVDSLCRALGEEAVGVEQGINLEKLIIAGSTIIFRIELEKSIQDFLVNWLLTFVFEYRTWSEDKFNQKPLIFVLDEQRNILRIRR